MKHCIGIAGLAVMGENLALNIESKGFSVAVYNRTHVRTQRFISSRAAGRDITGFDSVGEFALALATPRKIMLMLKAGDAIDRFIEQLLPHLEEGDIIIDGGNSHFQDTARRLAYLQGKKIRFIGTGVSGGEDGALNGPAIMPGGTASAWPHLAPIFLAVAAEAEDGAKCCAWMGAGGAGHFVKMVHNGIEYGDMQLICEGYHFMKSVLRMEAAEIQHLFSQWNAGQLKSYLIEITAEITAHLEDDGTPTLDKILDAAGQKGTGKWTVDAALTAGVPLSLISESVFARCLSGQKELRIAASTRLDGPDAAVEGDRPEMLTHLGKALYGAKIISYTQGFSLLRRVSEEMDWQLDLAQIARLFRRPHVRESGRPKGEMVPYQLDRGRR
jgi:6-phosphogluconate dehydrogenase